MKHDNDFGAHYLVEFIDCDAAAIAHGSGVTRCLLAAVESCGATYISHHSHQFDPSGVSAVVLIAESHFSIHTWPEKCYAAFDIFTCGDTMRPEQAIEDLKADFKARRTRVRVFRRGYSETNATSERS